MSWMKNLVQTYDKCQNIIGKDDGIGYDQSKMLLPIGHLLTEVNAIVKLREDGTFCDAEIINNKEKNLICIPCTIDSESRSGKNPNDFPHPLFDQIKFLLEANYLSNLEKWLKFIQNNNNYPLAYRCLNAVYQYIKNNTLINDLNEKYQKRHKKSDNEEQGQVKNDIFVAFAVYLIDYPEERLWKIKQISDAWIAYYLDEISKSNDRSICYVTGEIDYFTEKHPRSINRFAGNAKLITSNDTTNYTFKGRFNKSKESVTVSYEASQKAHQALRWLITNSWCSRNGAHSIVAWAIDDNIPVPNFFKDSFSLCHLSNQSQTTDEEMISQAKSKVFLDYANQLKKALRGYNSTVELKKHQRKIAILASDSSSTGRLGVSYYRELDENEYEERIIQWHDHCKWYQPFENGGYFIGAPSNKSISHAVLGIPRSQNDETYVKLEKNLNVQMVHCIFDAHKLPFSFVVAAVNHASNPIVYINREEQKSKKVPKNNKLLDWEKILCTACALVKKYYYDTYKEDFKVELETTRTDRDYLYGRLLAIADRIESYAKYKKGAEDSYLTNALRYMPVFAQHPFRTWTLLFSQLLNPYIQELKGAHWYLNEITKIKTKLFKPGDFESDAPLDGRYLMGFFAQKQELIQKNKVINGGEEHESNE